MEMTVSGSFRYPWMMDVVLAHGFVSKMYQPALPDCFFFDGRQRGSLPGIRNVRMFFARRELEGRIRVRCAARRSSPGRIDAAAE
jgi:hypothetical protein